MDIAHTYFARRLVRVRLLRDLVKILGESMPSLNELSPALQAEIVRQVGEQKAQSGSIILTTRPTLASSQQQQQEEDNENKTTTTSEDETVERKLGTDPLISFSAWLGKTSLRPLINVQTRSFFLAMCGVDKVTISKENNNSKPCT